MPVILDREPKQRPLRINGLVSPHLIVGQAMLRVRSQVILLLNLNGRHRPLGVTRQRGVRKPVAAVVVRLLGQTVLQALGEEPPHGSRVLFTVLELVDLIFGLVGEVVQFVPLGAIDHDVCGCGAEVGIGGVGAADVCHFYLDIGGPFQASAGACFVPYGDADILHAEAAEAEVRGGVLQPVWVDGDFGDVPGVVGDAAGGVGRVVVDAWFVLGRICCCGPI